MRLHTLRVQAFGPFADAVTVDIDRLSSDGLFLLHGETGAGKTTLLDAIAFALYGTVPGARADAKRLRSDLASPDVRTEVTIDATIAGRRFVLTRNPSYERPKRRGPGTTTQPAKVSLQWCSPLAHGDARSDLTRAEEVGAVIGELLGMSADQFFQVVLLPQGEFARFLRAGTKERQGLLEKLFDTVRFAQLEEAFLTHRRDRRDAATEAQGIVDQARARVIQAAGLDEVDHGEGSSGTDTLAIFAAQVLTTRPDDGDVRPASDGAARSVSADLLVHTLETRAGDIERRALLAEANLATASKALQGAQERNGLIERLRDVREQHRVLEDRRPDDVARGKAIDQARRAADVIRAHQDLKRAEDAYDQARASATAWEEQVPSSLRDDACVPKLQSTANRLRTELGGVAVLIDVAREQERDTRALSDLTAELADAAQRKKHAAETFADMPAKRAELDSRIAHARHDSELVDDRAGAVERESEILDAAQSLAKLAKDADQAARAHTVAVDELQTAREHRQQLIERRIADMAGELAGELADGVACVVCGAREHPAPAQRADVRIGDDDVARAQELEQRADERRNLAQTARADADHAYERARRAARGHDAAGARILLARAREQWDAALAARRELPQLLDEQRALVVAEDQTAARHAGLVAEVDRLAAARDALQRSIDDRAVRLADGADGHATVVERHAYLVAAADAVAGWAEALASVERAYHRRNEAFDRRENTVRDADFESIEEALAAGEIDIDQASAARAQYATECAVVAHALNAPELQELAQSGDCELVDLQSLAREVDHAAQVAENAGQEAVIIRRRCGETAAAVDRLRAAEDALAPLAYAAEEATALAEVIAGRGQNDRALSLRAYVLALKLREVAAVASTRLSAMSGGRYTLQYSDERESYGRGGGLGLDVVDAYSGRSRPTKTLSGGESFLASLALALALADVVAADAGARMLDTIFIDEGFGSLDSDALELVMSTLDELRAGGRVVGVVSHVGEMQQRIPTRAQVIKSVAGSRVELTTASSG